jgi:predicted DNA-binding transcriptional regulator YafY
MKDKLDPTDSLYVAARILAGEEAVAEFNYEDKNGQVTFRRVKVDSVVTDDHGNFVWYNYSDGGKGGGHRAFNAERINGFRFVRK